MKDRFSTGYLAKTLRLSRTTIYDWESRSIIPKAHRDKVSGRRFWTCEQIEEAKKKTGRG